MGPSSPRSTMTPLISQAPPTHDIISVGASKEGLIYLPLVVGGQLLPALLDSGAAVNVISCTVIKLLNIPTFSGREVHLRSACGTLSTTGTCVFRYLFP